MKDYQGISSACGICKRWLNDSDAQGPKKKPDDASACRVSKVKCAIAMQEKEHIIHNEGVFFVGETKREERMLTKASANDDGDRHRQQQAHAHVVIGDILLHSKSKLTIIRVVTPSLPSSTLSAVCDKPIIHRLSANSSGTNAPQTLVPCDLKNTPPVKADPERVKSSSSSKKLMRMQKAGLALVKEFRTKVINGNHPEPKASKAHTEFDHQQTQF